MSRPTTERRSPRRTPRRRALVALLLTFALFAAACGDDDGTATDADPDATVDSGTAAPDDSSTDDGANDPAGDDVALANAIRIDASVDARIADAADYTDVSDPVPVAAGDNVRTDTTGFAEIAYFDGSVTRLDIDTDFTVVELVNSPGDSVIRTQMGVGRTWHRVQALTGNDTYEVETTVATAVVRGTAFIIECDATTCTFTVLEGTIELILPDGTTITLQAGETITITIDATPGDPTPIAGNPFDDEWLARNNDLDTDTGGDDLTDDYAGPAEIDPSFERGITLVCGWASETASIPPGENYWLIEGGTATYRAGQTLATEEAGLILLTGEAGFELEAFGDQVLAVASALPTDTLVGPSGADLVGVVQTAEMVALAEEILGVCAGLGWS